MTALLDLDSVDLANSDLRSLYELLIEAYPTIQDVHLRAEFVGIKINSLTPNLAPRPAWREVMERAAKKGVLRRLVEEARDDDDTSTYSDRFAVFLTLRAPEPAADPEEPAAPPPARPRNPTTALRNFLSTHFTVDGIRRELSDLYGSALWNALPMGGSHANFMFELVLAMQRRGYLKDPDLYRELLRARPGLGDEIKSIADAFGVPPGRL